MSTGREPRRRLRIGELSLDQSAVSVPLPATIATFVNVALTVRPEGSVALSVPFTAAPRARRPCTR